MNEKTIGLIGGGRVARIILKGLAHSGGFSGYVKIYDMNPGCLAGFADILPGHITVASALEEIASCDLVFLAIHPPVIMETLGILKPLLPSGCFIVSLAPKIRIQEMQDALGGHASIARVNPSAPGIIGEGFNPVSYSKNANDADRQYLERLLSLLGTVKVVDEKTIEAYAVVSAMGPTYFWFQLQQLKELAREFGLSEADASEAIEIMIQGTARTLFHSALEPEAVMDLVPVKPIGESESEIKSIYAEKLRGLFAKIKP